MSSFNNIYKVKYDKNTQDPVSLSEYIIFEDERTEEKYLVFKFKNNLSQSLYQIRVEITVYDNNENIVEKLTMDYGDFSAYDNEDFVPNAKLKVDPTCKSVSAKLIYARFERTEWNEGSYTVIPYTAQNFTEDFSKKKPTQPKIDKKAAKLEKKQKRGKRKTKIYSVIHKNYPGAPKVFTSIFAILCIAFVVVTLILFKKNTGVFSDGDYDFNPISSNEVCLKNYVGKSTSVIIPEKVNNYTVVEIGEEAFANSKVTKVEIQAKSLKINANAFKNSQLSEIVNPEAIVFVSESAFEGTKLTDVTLENATRIKSQAFANCQTLNRVSAPKATISDNAFQNDYLYELSYLSSDSSYFYAMFDKDDDTSASKVGSVICGLASISNVYFKNCTGLYSVEFTNNPTFAYGCLKDTAVHNHAMNEEYEILDGQVIASASEEIVVFSSDISTFEKTISYCNKDKVTKIIIRDPSFKLDGNQLSQFPYLKELEISSLSSISQVTPLNLSKISTLTVPSTTDYSKYFSATMMKRVTNLSITGTTSISTTALSGFTNVKTLSIGKSVKSIATDALKSQTSLESLTIPYTDKTFAQLGVSQTLTTVKLTLGNQTATPKDYINSYAKLKSITMENGLKTMGGYFLSECPLVETLTIPSTVTTMTYSVIGSGCTRLSKVSTPFVGLSAYYGIAYKQFNESYSATNQLSITGESTLCENFSEDLSNLVALSVLGYGELKVNSLASATNLRYLNVNTNSLYDVKNATNDFKESSLETLVLNLKGDADLSYLKSSKIKELILVKGSKVTLAEFAYLPLNYIYFGKSVYFSGDWSKVLIGTKVDISFESQKPTDFDNYYHYTESVTLDKAKEYSMNYAAYSE